MARVGEWTIPYGAPAVYPVHTIAATVGTQIRPAYASFSGTGAKTVVQLPTRAAWEACDFLGGVLLHNFATDGPAFDIG